MFAVIYRGFVFLDREKEYQKAWRQVADYFVTHCGALGSSLHKSDEGEWIAYSKWPDKETRDASWIGEVGLSDEIKLAIKNLRDCVDREKPYEEIAMNLIDQVN